MAISELCLITKDFQVCLNVIQNPGQIRLSSLNRCTASKLLFYFPNAVSFNSFVKDTKSPQYSIIKRQNKY